MVECARMCICTDLLDDIKVQRNAGRVLLKVPMPDHFAGTCCQSLMTISGQLLPCMLWDHLPGPCSRSFCSLTCLSISLPQDPGCICLPPGQFVENLKFIETVGRQENSTERPNTAPHLSAAGLPFRVTNTHVACLRLHLLLVLCASGYFVYYECAVLCTVIFLIVIIPLIN